MPTRAGVQPARESDKSFGGVWWRCGVTAAHAPREL
jgi:hypothetical protein